MPAGCTLTVGLAVFSCLEALMADNSVYPVNLDTFTKLVEASGYKMHQADEERGRLTLDIKGEETVLRLHVILGKTPDGEAVWYTRFLSYSLDFEPVKAGLEAARVVEWLNAKNADLLFGRYYYDDKTDTVAFEVAIPCNGGILGEDFEDLLRIATVSVDKTHKDLKALLA
jgi:hypothetical protein